jgi:endoglucanase
MSHAVAQTSLGRDLGDSVPGRGVTFLDRHCRRFGLRPLADRCYEFSKCLEVQGGNIDNSAQVQLWDCDGTKLHREWYMQEVQPGWWHIWNAKSGKCLNVQGASTKNSAKIIQYSCQGVSKFNDQWELRYIQPGDNGDLYLIINRLSNKCLNVQGASTANGTDLIQYTCGGGWNGVFTWWPGS